MKPLLIATTNAGKIKEVQGHLKGAFELFTPRDSRFEGTSVPKVVEDGRSYFENSVKKALEFYAVYKVPVLADDSGLEVDVLKGQPGVDSAHLGGENLSWAARWEALYKMLRPFPSAQWTGRFRSVLCYYDGKRVPFFFQGLCEGMVVSSPRGEGGFGYDPIFLSTGLKKTFGEASPAEKAQVSHRARSLDDFLAWSKLDHV